VSTESNPELSPSAKAGAGAGGLTALLGTGYLLGKGLWVFVAILFVLLALLLGGYFLWGWWRRRRQSARMSGELRQQSAASPRGISDPGHRARLDDMRKKFEEGVQAYRSRGKDIYSLPWYAIVGEPGSGKTEAVRHSSVGFPPGMQDEFQGVGGTLNMNWWFTNHAVLLDTAGRLMFEEVKPGETSEWKEFLTLLRKYRPNCPINGLILVIPSDSLIKDNAEDIQRKAGKIAQQLDVIQRTLDVRFPVFVLITKCDKILGFREFFDGVTDPQAQHQMLGWANPDPLDTPFRPDQVDRHIDTVVHRLRRRRLALLRDPVPESDKPDARRVDEVDTLYALPNSLAAIAPGLRRYLETIFVAGEWSAKPLFLRGIYFSSSMREGAALDQDLAEAMGMPVDELGDFKVWERERSFFLRDLFLEKVFKERGLVTRATNTGAMLRRRKLVLYSCGIAALAVFGILAWFSTQSLKKSVAVQSQAWQALVREGWWDDQVWKKALIPRRSDLTYVYETNTARIEGHPGLPEFQARLREIATNQLRASLLQRFFAPGLAADYNATSRTDQRIAFETAVVKPLVAATRQRLNDTEEGPENPDRLRRFGESLALLVNLEASILTRGSGTNAGTLDEAGVRALADPLLAFVAGASLTLHTNLAATWAWTYTANDAARGSWPPGWLSDTNALFAGLDGLKRGLTNGLAAQAVGWNRLVELQRLLEAIAAQERALLAAVQSGAFDGITNAHAGLVHAKHKLDAWLAERPQAESPLLKAGLSLTNAADLFRRDAAGIGADALDRVRAANDVALVQTKNHATFKELQRRLKQIEVDLAGEWARLASPAQLDEFRRIEAAMLARIEDKPAFAFRCDRYQAALDLLPKPGWIGAWRPGLKGRPLQEFLAGEVEPLRRAATHYAGGFKEGFGPIVSGLATLGEKARVAEYFEHYHREATGQLRGKLAFPLLLESTNTVAFADLDALGGMLKLIGDDLGSPLFQSLGAASQPGWEPFAKAVPKLNDLVAALGGDAPGRVTVSLAPLDDAHRTQDVWRDTLRRVQLDGGERLDSNNPDKPLGTVAVDAPLTLTLSDQLETPVNRARQTTSPWGSLWLALRLKGQPEPGDPRTWRVDWPVAEPRFKGAVRLKLHFERPLPDPKTWAVPAF
jgi:hypothetical protein